MDRERMTAYWSSIGNRDDVKRHIAEIDDADAFFASARADLELLFGPNLNAIKEGARVLEVGCGIGRLSLALAKSRPDVLVSGVDVAPTMISQALELSRETRNCSFVVGDGVSLKVYPDACFDVVFSFIVFQHLPRHIVGQYCSDAARVLKPGGLFFFQLQEASFVQDVDPPWDDFRQIRYYTRAQGEALVRRPLRVSIIDGQGHNMVVRATKEPSKETAPSV